MANAGKIGLLVATVALTTLVYFTGDFKGEGKKPEETPVEEATTAPAFDYQLYKQTQIQALEPAPKESLQKLEEELAKAADTETKVALLNQLIAQTEQLKLELVSTMYSKDIALLRNDAVIWDKTGAYFMSLFYDQPEEPAAQQFKLEQARESFSKAAELDTANLDYKVRLGVTFMEDQTQTMQGVQLLLGVVEKDSNHVNAQLYLGRFGIISGQYEKAVARLDKVISLDSLNVEAYILMADAQKALGNTARAVEYLEKVKTLVSDPEFSKNVDAYIEKIKNT